VYWNGVRERWIGINEERIGDTIYGTGKKGGVMGLGMRATTTGADNQVVASLYGGELGNALDPRQAKQTRTAAAFYSRQKYAEAHI